MKRILVIEDEDALRDALVAHLTTLGYVAEGVFTAEEGLRRAVEAPPDLILLDVLTHSLHASVFLEQLREETSPAKDVPVIVLTNVDDAEIRARLTAFGIAGYFIKANVTLAEISDAIKKLSSASAN